MSKVKILFLDHTPFVGGAQLAMIELIKKLDRQQFDLLIVNSTRAEELGLTKEYQAAQLNYLLIPFTKLKQGGFLKILAWLADLKQLIKIIRTEKVDIIVTNTVRAAIFAALSNIFTRRSLIWYLLDYTFPRPLFNILKVCPRKIFYVSRSVAEYYEGNKVEPDQVFYLWSNFLEKAASLDPALITQRRNELKINKEEILIAYFGRLVTWKGPQVLLAALKILRAEGQANIKVVIGGTGRGQAGNNEKELHDFVVTNDLSEQVIFLGQQPEVVSYLAASNIYCLTSIEAEPFSSVVLEAMLTKVPVIATVTGGTPEIAGPGEQLCLFVPPNSPTALARAIKELIDNPYQAEELARAAYQKVSQSYLVSQAAKSWEKIFINNL